jgi:8-oxo-dGTP pyrophosphatase MutT (NUDIX family)
VGGHQHLGDESTHQFVAHHFRAVLLNSQHQHRDLVLYSALALGADQLFVQIALELGVPVEIVVPCAEYEQIFPTEMEKREYHRLLHASQRIHALPEETCSDEAFLAAGQWIVEHSDLVVLAWNGLPPQGKGGTGDMASYARSIGCPFMHLDTRHHTVKSYPAKPSFRRGSARLSAPHEEMTVTKQPVYQGPLLSVKRYQIALPDGEEVIRDVVERPESVLVLPIGPKDLVLLIEEYDFGAGVWQLTLPGGKVEPASGETLLEQVQKELRQETGYQAGRVEKLIDFYSHPGYISHRVHVFLAYDLEWDPLEQDRHEEIRVRTYELKEALTETRMDYRFDPEAALALWIYAGKAGRSRHTQ